MNFRKIWGGKIGISMAIFFAFVLFVQGAKSLPKCASPGICQRWFLTLKPLGRLESSNELTLSIALPLHNRNALTNFLDQIYDPASPQYHHYLTPEQFDARFGPTEDDYKAVSAWAERNGFAITGRHPNRMLLEVSGSVANIERSLQVRLETYAQPAEARTFYAPDAEPAVDAGLPIFLHWRPG